MMKILRGLTVSVIIILSGIFLSACTHNDDNEATGISPASSESAVTPLSDQVEAPSVQEDRKELNDSVLGYRLMYPQAWYVYKAKSAVDSTILTSYDPGSDVYHNQSNVPKDQIKIKITKYDPLDDQIYRPPNPDRVTLEKKIQVASSSAVWQQVSEGDNSIRVLLNDDKNSTYVISASPADSDRIAEFEEILKSFTFKQNVSLTTPKVNQIIDSPVKIVGYAPASWASDDQISIRIETLSGVTLAMGNFKVNGSRTGDEPASFSDNLRFNPPVNISRGKIVVIRSNPENNPDLQESFEVPVIFE